LEINIAGKLYQLYLVTGPGQDVVVVAEQQGKKRFNRLGAEPFHGDPESGLRLPSLPAIRGKGQGVNVIQGRK